MRRVWRRVNPSVHIRSSAMPLRTMKKPARTRAPIAGRKRLDRLSKEQRSQRMTRIRSRDTQPELALRQMVYSLGYRYRLHDRRLPGRPDLVFSSRRCVIFMHGCLWHQHDCGTYKQPVSQAWFWSRKLSNNVLRDSEVRKRLTHEGWRSLIVWECELRSNPEKIAWRVIRFLQ